MAQPPKITSPDGRPLDELCQQLAGMSTQLDGPGCWPEEQLRLCGQYGVYEWFLEPEWGGQGWGGVDVVQGYQRLSAACLTTTFIITQRTGACRRIAQSENELLKEKLLPPLARGDAFATVGISHLTTSRRHLSRPVLRAQEMDEGFRLNGFSPWVTGAKHAETVVTGGTFSDGRQVLLAVPMDLPGIAVPEPPELVGLTSSHTGEVRFSEVVVPRERLLAGPVENVMAQGVGAATGGLQTSTLAVGLAAAAIGYLEEESAKRPDLNQPLGALRSEYLALQNDLLALAGGVEICTTDQLRQRANSLVLRATQAALFAAKGTGYVIGHPAGRWCREALFFLVWSCPQSVMQANLCELAGIEG